VFRERNNEIRFFKTSKSSTKNCRTIKQSLL
jgi:hypothetical protein